MLMFEPFLGGGVEVKRVTPYSFKVIYNSEINYKPGLYSNTFIKKFYMQILYLLDRL